MTLEVGAWVGKLQASNVHNQFDNSESDTSSPSALNLIHFCKDIKDIYLSPVDFLPSKGGNSSMIVSRKWNSLRLTKFSKVRSFKGIISISFAISTVLHPAAISCQCHCCSHTEGALSKWHQRSFPFNQIQLKLFRMAPTTSGRFDSHTRVGL